MSKYLSDPEELERLNELCRGKTIEWITYDKIGDSILELVFTDGNHVVLSTLGGIEIEDNR